MFRISVRKRLVINGRVYGDPEEAQPRASASTPPASASGEAGGRHTLERSVPITIAGGHHRDAPTTPPPIEPSGMEAGVRAALVAMGLVFVLGLAAWLFLIRR